MDWLIFIATLAVMLLGFYPMKKIDDFFAKQNIEKNSNNDDRGNTNE
ncbi:MAG: hypothetical protein PUD93_06090 [Lachnospiraceae bacterium]|nr:hypothetical protein [Lachnospiraceae bacterium]